MTKGKEQSQLSVKQDIKGRGTSQRREIGLQVPSRPVESGVEPRSRPPYELSLDAQVEQNTKLRDDRAGGARPNVESNVRVRVETILS